MRRLACLVLLAGCGDGATPPAQTTPPPIAAPEPVFSEVASQTGLVFRHFLGATGEFFFPEIAGSGVAVLDFDGDGDLDVYAVQGTMLEAGRSPRTSIIPPADDAPPVNRLFRNELVPGGTLAFTDVTAGSGLDDAGYGMGVAVGDVDNDGDPDVFVSNFGQNRLFENRGDGTFRLVADAMQVDDDQEWTTSASFTDYDADGDLDLFATNYVGFTLVNNIACTGSKGQREYCGPNIYPPTTDRLWRNDGGWRFVDVSEASGIATATGNGLGAVATDFDGDGDIDLYVANDLMENRMWLQESEGRFVDRALMSGTAYNANGAPEASMGVTAGDFDADGDEDLFMTHLNAETNTLYRNEGDGQFVDVTDVANLAASSLRLTGFGTAWFDYDNDGALDLFIANGAVVEQSGEGLDPDFPYGQVNQLLRNEGARFRDASVLAGPVAALKETSRGAAFGDIDNDGDVDVVVSNGNGPLRLMRNDIDNAHHWLRVRLVGTRGNRDGAGARVVLLRAGLPSLWRRAHSDGSYLSASDIRVHMGLGPSPEYEAIGVVWPDGTRERWPSLGADREVVLREGAGEPWRD